MTEFDRATSLRSIGDGRYEAQLDPGWRIGRAVNGGILMALASRAMSEEFSTEGHGHPFSISGYFLSASNPGPAELEVERLRTGSMMTTGQLTLSQDRTDRLRVLATYGSHDSLTDEVRTVATPPRLPPPEECLAASSGPREMLGASDLLDRTELRLDPESAAWAMGRPSGRGVVQGWLRMADGREPDVHQLVFATDSLPPVTFDLGVFGWAPTLELTVHVRAEPAPGWLVVRHSTRNFAGGLLEEDGEVWDSSGRLVAQSRQLAMAPRKRSG